MTIYGVYNFHFVSRAGASHVHVGWGELQSNVTGILKILNMEQTFYLPWWEKER